MTANRERTPMTRSNDEDEPFLRRWSRRKREAANEAPDTFASDIPAATSDARPAAPLPAAAGTEPELDLSRLPRVEELTETSDISVFLDRRVPAALRNAALGRMWTLDPTIRDFIEVAENQWNWNVPGGAPFYSIIEPGTDAGQAIAGIGDTMVSPTAPALVDSRRDEVPGDGASERSRSFDQLAQESVATQHDPSTEAILPRNDASTERPRADLTEMDERGVVAAQRTFPADAEAAAPLRRRHGGALPV